MDKNCKLVIAFLLGILAYYFYLKKDLVEGACVGGDNCGEITGHAECVEQSGCRLEGTTIEGENTIISSTIPTADLPGIIRSIESTNTGLSNLSNLSGFTRIVGVYQMYQQEKLILEVEHYLYLQIRALKISI